MKNKKDEKIVYAKGSGKTPQTKIRQVKDKKRKKKPIANLAGILTLIILFGVFFCVAFSLFKYQPKTNNLTKFGSKTSSLSRVESSKNESSIIEPSVEASAIVPEVPQLQSYSFVVNESTNVYHTRNCPAVQKMKDENKRTITLEAYSYSEAENKIRSRGYSLCGRCNRY